MTRPNNRLPNRGASFVAVNRSSDFDNDKNHDHSMEQQQPLPTTPLPQRDGSVRRLLVDSVPGGFECQWPGCVQTFSTYELLAGHRQIVHSSHNNRSLNYEYQQAPIGFIHRTPDSDSHYPHKRTLSAPQQEERTPSPAGLLNSPDKCGWEGCKGRFFTDRMRNAHIQTHIEAPPVPTHGGDTLHDTSASDAKRD